MLNENNREQYCTSFVWGDYDHDDLSSLCTCPNCNGFLSRSFPSSEGKQWQCKKCGSVLETIIDPPSEDDIEAHIEYYTHGMGVLYALGLEPIPVCPSNDEFFSGRICVVPEYAIKIPQIDFDELRKKEPPKKHLTGERVYGASFVRSVWRDKDGSFIEIAGKRILVGSPEFHKIVQGRISKKG